MYSVWFRTEIWITGEKKCPIFGSVVVAGINCGLFQIFKIVINNIRSILTWTSGAGCFVRVVSAVVDFIAD